MRISVWLVCSLVISVPGFAQQTGSATGKHTPAPTSRAAAPAPAHPITVDQVHEMMRLTGTNRLQKQMLDGFMPYLRESMPFLPDDVLTDFQSSLEKTDFTPMIVQSYQAHMSTEDAAQIIAFYRTPAGQHMIAEMPSIIGETQKTGARLGQQVMLQVLQRHKAEIQAAAQKYQQQRSSPPPQP